MSKHKYHKKGKEEEEVKLPKKGGLDKARSRLKELRKPSIVIVIGKDEEMEEEPKKSSSSKRLAMKRKQK